MSMNFGFNVPPYIMPDGYTKMPYDIIPYFNAGNKAFSYDAAGYRSYNFWPSGYDAPVYDIASNIWGHMQDPMGIGDPQKAGVGFLTQAYTQLFIQNAPQQLNALEAQLNSALKAEELDEAQKSKLQAELAQIKALKDRCDQAVKNNPTMETIDNLNKEIKEMQKSIDTVINEISTQLAERAAQGNDGSGGAADSTGSTGAAGDTGSDGVETPEEKAAREELKKQKETEAKSLSDAIFTALDGCGTNNSLLNNSIKAINKDNVIEVFDAWNKDHSGEGSLMERIYDDKWDDWAGDGKTCAEGLLAALEAKAQELGISSQITGDVLAVRSELDATWNTDEDIVSNKLDSIHKKIKSHIEAQEAKAEQARKDAESKKAAEDTKAKTEQTKKDNEAKTQFLTDMREILGDEKLEISDKVTKDENGFKVRIEGIDYYGSSYRELADKIKRAGYDPKQYLTKQELNQTA